MNTIVTVLTLISAHQIGDWFCQPRTMAMKKSSELEVLLAHVFIVTVFLFIGVFSLVAMDALPTLSESLIKIPIWMKLILNGAIHGLIDWNIWDHYKKGKSSDFKYWLDKEFYDTVAIDQWLHLATLMILFL